LLGLHQRDADDFRDTLQVGAALQGEGRWKWAAGQAGPELLWLLGPEGLEAYDRLTPVEPDSMVRHFSSSGLVVLRDGWNERSSYVFVDAGPHGAMNYVHAHADALSFEYASNGVTWIVDPGTYTYTNDAALRDEFRSSSGHNTLVVEGQSQSQPNGPFSWAQVAEAILQDVTETAEGVRCVGEQNGYERLDPPVRHQRSVQLLRRPDRPSESYLLIEDRAATAGSYRYELRFHFAPDCKPGRSNGRFVVHHPNGPQLAMSSWRIDDKRRGTPLPISVEEGWVSREYARRDAAPVVVAEAQGAGDHTFVTILAPVDREAAIELERLAQVNAERDVLAA
jgi:hypothetical protein